MNQVVENYLESLSKIKLDRIPAAQFTGKKRNFEECVNMSILNSSGGEQGISNISSQEARQLKLKKVLKCDTSEIQENVCQEKQADRQTGGQGEVHLQSNLQTSSGV